MQSAGRTFGFESLLREAQRVEELAVANDLDAAGRAFAKLDDAVTALVRDLEARAPPGAPQIELSP
jgi:hypothetical protein